ncbi:MAG: enoyl-CoA hydratase/isomerase family protein [Gammaproteobacteria bacterium]|uniref:enoyl-CoA hydratase/isomerase family protein n=1 Tax=Azohydromonas sp. TaxID=1872666 RepID=UPI002BCF5300|nr:enoyl-CoA hydratase-related protein [Azohydromonas sp.]HMM85949.1 enoyl-CoA hydratase-related protein [Azohydromonas sp.]
MNADAYESLALRRDGGVLHVTLNRPRSRNAMTMAMVRELRTVLADAKQAGDVRVLVLRGAGGHFCAGADLNDMAAARQRAMRPDDDKRPLEPAADPIAEISARFGELCVAWADTGLATVAVLEGTVMGGGFGLACVVDVAIASDTATFRLPETSLGVVPAQIAAFLVERLGYAEAKRLAVTGGTLDARQALALRLVHEVHAPDGVDAALHRVVGEILCCAPGAVSATKALLARARFTPPVELVREAAAVFSRSAGSAEGIEGTAAFIARRKPTWAP